MPATDAVAIFLTCAKTNILVLSRTISLNDSDVVDHRLPDFRRLYFIRHNLEINGFGLPGCPGKFKSRSSRRGVEAGDCPREASVVMRIGWYATAKFRSGFISTCLLR